MNSEITGASKCLKSKVRFYFCIVTGLVILLNCSVGLEPSFGEPKSSSHQQETQEANLLISIGDQLWDIGFQRGALEKYYEAVETDPLNIATIRRLVFRYRESNHDERGWFAKKLRVDDSIFFLRLIYQLQAIEPNLHNDTKLLWAQVSFLEQAVDQEIRKYAGNVLEEIKMLNPDDPEVLVKLGTFYVMSRPSSKQEKEDGIELIKQAIDLNPQETRYLRNLGEAFIENENDAEAIRVYHRATETIKGDSKHAKFERQKFAVYGMKVFHEHASRHKERGILSPSLNMTLEERVKIFAELFSFVDPKNIESRQRQTVVWGERYLVTLYLYTDQIKKAENVIGKLLAGEGFGQANDVYHIGQDRTKDWIDILERKASTSKVLTTLQAAYDEEWGEKPKPPIEKEQR